MFHGRSWLTLSTPSFFAGRRGFSHSFQLRASTLRSLTFGVLIVVIGTFAALPFRRYRATQQPLPPTEATGPTQSALGGLEFEMLVEDSTLEAGFPSLALPTAEAWQSPKRQIRMPLTYDDLGVPLMLPPAFHENFSATSTAQAAQG